jgi:hypothetical protein
MNNQPTSSLLSISVSVYPSHLSFLLTAHGLRQDFFVIIGSFLCMDNGTVKNEQNELPNPNSNN